MRTYIENNRGAMADWGAGHLQFARNRILLIIDNGNWLYNESNVYTGVMSEEEYEAMQECIQLSKHWTVKFYLKAEMGHAISSGPPDCQRCALAGD